MAGLRLQSKYSNSITSVLSSIPCIIVTTDLQVKKLESKGIYLVTSRSLTGEGKGQERGHWNPGLGIYNISLSTIILSNRWCPSQRAPLLGSSLESSIEMHIHSFWASTECTWAFILATAEPRILELVGPCKSNEFHKHLLSLQCASEKDPCDLCPRNSQSSGESCFTCEKSYARLI